MSGGGSSVMRRGWRESDKAVGTRYLAAVHRTRHSRARFGVVKGVVWVCLDREWPCSPGRLLTPAKGPSFAWTKSTLESRSQAGDAASVVRNQAAGLSKCDVVVSLYGRAVASMPAQRFQELWPQVQIVVSFPDVDPAGASGSPRQAQSTCSSEMPLSTNSCDL